MVEQQQGGHQRKVKAAKVAVRRPEGNLTWGTQKVLEDKYLYH